MKILITGGTGSVGKILVPMLLDKNYDLTLTTRNEKKAITKNSKWADKVKGWDTVIVSGMCPVDSNGGLLNRTYDMALVEESSTYYGLPHFGSCSEEMCETLIDYDDPSCTGVIAVYPDNPAVMRCGDICPVFTVYDATRYPIAGTDQIIRDMNAGPSPYLEGCPQLIPIDTDEKRRLYCYSSYGQPKGGGRLVHQGRIKWPILSADEDVCKNADYSLYIEAGKWSNFANQSNVPVSRVFAITYGMKDPITMKVSYVDTDVPKIYQCELPEMMEEQ